MYTRISYNLKSLRLIFFFLTTAYVLNFIFLSRILFGVFRSIKIEFRTSTALSAMRFQVQTSVEWTNFLWGTLVSPYSSVNLNFKYIFVTRILFGQKFN